MSSLLQTKFYTNTPPGVFVNNSKNNAFYLYSNTDKKRYFSCIILRYQTALRYVPTTYPCLVCTGWCTSLCSCCCLLTHHWNIGTTPCWTQCLSSASYATELYCTSHGLWKALFAYGAWNLVKSEYLLVTLLPFHLNWDTK